MAHHLIIQKDVDELLVKDASEPSTGGGTGFYWTVFVVHKNTGGLWAILNLKWINCFMHIHTLRCFL